MHQPKPRFRLNILFLMMLATILPTLGILSADYNRLRQQVLDSSRDQLVSCAREGSRQLEQWITEQRDSTTAHARARELAENWLAFQTKDTPLTRERLNEALANFNQSSPWINEVRLSSLDGTVVVSDNPVAEGQPFVAAAGAVSLREIVEGRKTLTSQVYNSTIPVPIGIEARERVQGLPTVMVSAPILRKDEVLGVLGCRLAVSDLKRLLHSEVSFTPVDVYLLTREGALVSSNSQIPAGRMFPIPGGSWPSAGYNLDGFLDGEGKRRVGAWQSVPGTDMVVLVAMQATRIDQLLRVERHTLLAYGVAVAGFGLFVFVRLGLLLRPLESLTLMAQKLSEGNFSVRVPLEGDDEFGQLGMVFNQMAETMETTMSGLSQARDAAQAGDRAKGRFLATMTHELRTPLNAIIGYSEMIMAEVSDGEPDPDQLKEDLEVIRSSGKDLLGLINSILDFSRIESGKIELNAEEFNPADLVREVCALHQSQVAANGNTLHLGLKDPLGVVVMDPVRFKQILTNLLSNACKFTTQGEIRVRARVDSDHLVVEIEDTGIGMNENEQKRCFLDFAQADESISRRYGGTGLGLTVVQRLVTLMGGHVRLKSAPQQGSTFTVNLPRREIVPD